MLLAVRQEGAKQGKKVLGDAGFAALDHGSRDADAHEWSVKSLPGYNVKTCRASATDGLPAKAGTPYPLEVPALTGLLQPVGYPGLAQIVGRHFQSHAVADCEANEMLAHFTREMS